jgi:hypothetical protein
VVVVGRVKVLKVLTALAVMRAWLRTQQQPRRRRRRRKRRRLRSQ